MLSATFILAVFTLGALFGASCLALYAISRYRKFDEDRMKFSKDLAKGIEDMAKKASSAKDRINKAFDICEQQFAILAGMEGPQSGPLHGKHKQQMSAELKRLEEEKMTILRSVLADGYDPKLVTINESGEREAIRLSEFIKKRELIEQEKSGNVSKAPEAPVRKLSLIKNTEQEESPK